MRFIHLADVHLGAVPDRGYPWSEKRENEIWGTFRRIIAGIREHPVDLLFKMCIRDRAQMEISEISAGIMISRSYG